MSDRPAAPYPADTRAKGWRFELAYEQIEQSDTWGLAGALALEGKPLARPLLLAMWYAAWKQTPCGSLPANERLLSAAIGVPASVVSEYREVLLRGWCQADDGRLYHPTLIERVLEMMAKRRSESDRKAIARRGKKPQASPPDDGENPDLSHGTPTGHPQESNGTPTGVPRESDTRTGTRTSTSNPPPTEPSVPTAGGRAPADDPDADSAEGQGSDPPTVGTPYGLIARRLRQAGFSEASPHNLRFRTLVDAGVTAEEFSPYTARALSEADGSPFAYLLGIVEGERKRVARTAGQLHRGPMPVAANRQEALEKRNRAIADQWAAQAREETS